MFQLNDQLNQHNSRIINFDNDMSRVIDISFLQKFMIN